LDKTLVDISYLLLLYDANFRLMAD